MQEADSDALPMLPGCQLRLRKHSQILQIRPSQCHQGLRNLLLLAKSLCHVGSPQQQLNTSLSSHIREVSGANKLDGMIEIPYLHQDFCGWCLSVRPPQFIPGILAQLKSFYLIDS